jgi:hypothetical protein
LENEVVKYEYNVKRGDMIMTDVGSAVLMRQTRAKWFYLFKNKMISVRKSDFWEYVDLGKIKISYVKVAKYRTKQRKMRTLDLRGENPPEEQVSRFLKFERFAKPPFNIAFNYSTDLDTQYFIGVAESLNLDYEIERRPSGPAMFRIFGHD